MQKGKPSRWSTEETCWFSLGQSALHMWGPHLQYMCYSLIWAAPREVTLDLVCQQNKKQHDGLKWQCASSVVSHFISKSGPPSQHLQVTHMSEHTSLLKGLENCKRG